MGGQRLVSARRRAVLPVLALLLAAAVASVVYMLFTFQEFEETSVQSDLSRRAAATRLRVRLARAGPQRRGDLVAAPATSEEVRAMVAFCDTARPSDVAALREIALGGKDTLAVANAVRALGRLRVFARDPTLAGLVRDPRTRVRDEAILALGESGSEEAAQTLEPLATDADPRVRLLALRALGRLGGERSRSVARQVLANPASTREERAFARVAARGRS